MKQLKRSFSWKNNFVFEWFFDLFAFHASTKKDCIIEWSFGNPLTRSLHCIFEIYLILAYPQLLCHDIASSFIDINHETFWDYNSFIFILYKFPCLFAINTNEPLSFKTLHWSFSRVTLYPLSHNWLILNRFCFRPSTNKTLSIESERFVPIFPIPMILTFGFPPKVTNLPFLFLRLRNIHLSLAMCREQPLSRYQDRVFCYVIKQICKINYFSLIYPYCISSLLVCCMHLIFSRSRCITRWPNNFNILGFISIVCITPIES